MKRFLLATSLVAALALAAGIGYAAIPDSQGKIHACMLKATGTIRLIDTSLGAQSLRGHCTAVETEVTWSQQGPVGATGPQGQQGPAGNTDSVERHISNFMFDGTTTTTPILSGRGELGKLSLLCGSDANGGNGEITFTQSGDASFAPRVIFYSPAIAGPPTLSVVNDQITFPWADTAGENIIFEIMIEAQPGPVPDLKPTLTEIHGFVQHLSFGACSYYVHLDTSDVDSPESFSP